MLKLLRNHWINQIGNALSIGLMAGLTTISYVEPLFGASPPAQNLYHPEWWQDREVIDEEKPLQNSAPVNLGQLKWISTQLHQELDVLLPKGEINGQSFGGASFDLDTFFPAAPDVLDAADLETNSKIANLGQAKNIAKPFYDRLNAISPDWVRQELNKSGLGIPNPPAGAAPSDPPPASPYLLTSAQANADANDGYLPEHVGNYYPWTIQAGDDLNNAPLNIGQLKLLFALRARADNEVAPNADGLPDLFELALTQLSDAQYAAYASQEGATNPFRGLGLSEISADETGAFVLFRNQENPDGEGFLQSDGTITSSEWSASRAAATPYFADNTEIMDLLRQHEIVGSLGGSLSVGGDGAANYVVPIKLPRGSGGFGPQLTINYSSNGGNGLLGLGFSLAGFQSITRGKGHRIKDGYLPEEYKPIFSEQDRYFLDGELLVGTEDGQGNALGRDIDSAIKYVKGNGVTYHTEKESFAEIKGVGTSGEWGPSHFRVRSKDGKILEFGNCTTSCITDPFGKGAMAWHLNKVTDLNGNYYEIEYERDIIDATPATYETSDFRPKRIKFTANANAGTDFHHEVVFHYESRPDKTFAYVGGVKVNASRRLHRIEVNSIFGGTRNLCSYDLRYTQSVQTGRSLLEEIRHIASTGESTQPTVFNWNQPDVDMSQPSSMWKPTTQWNVPKFYLKRDKDDHRQDDQGRRFIDVNSDGYLDLIQANATFNNDGTVGGETSVLYNNGSTFQTEDPVNPNSNWTVPDDVWLGVNIEKDLDYALYSTANPYPQIADFNGDGQIDFLGRETDNVEDTDQGWHLKFETWINMWFPTYIRDLKTNSWTRERLPVKVYDKNRVKKGYRFAKGMTYSEVLDLDGDGDQDFVMKTKETVLQEESGTENIKDKDGNVVSYGEPPTPKSIMFLNRYDEGLGWERLDLDHGMPIDPYDYHRQQGLGTQLVDIDGDGLVDILKNNAWQDLEGNIDPESERAFLNRGGVAGWFDTSSQGWIPRRPLTDGFGFDVDTRLVDLNGDGLVDQRGNSGVKVANAIPESQRYRFVSASRFGTRYENILTGELYGAGHSFVGGGGSADMFAVDQDGDENVDYYAKVTFMESYLSQLEDHKKWRVTEWRDSIVRFGRINVLPRTPVTAVNVATSEEINVSDLLIHRAGRRYQSGIADLFSKEYYLWGANNEFLVKAEDILQPTDLPERFQSDLSFNRGTPLTDSNGDQIIYSAWVDQRDEEGFYYDIAYPISEKNKDRGSEFLDINGDGLTDLLVASTIEKNGVEDDRNDAFINTGYGFVPRTAWKFPVGVRICYDEEDVEKQRRHAFFRDLNGDGFPDLVSNLYETEESNKPGHYTQAPRVFINQSVDEIITGVTGDFGRGLVVEYKRLNDSSLAPRAERPTYTKGDQAAITEQDSHQVGICDASLVVSRIGQPRIKDASSDSHYFWKRYHYGDLRYDRFWNTSLGFAWMETIDEMTERCTYVKKRQDYPLHGLPTFTTTKIKGAQDTYEDGITISCEAVDYSIKTQVSTDLCGHTNHNSCTWPAWRVGTGGFVYSIQQKATAKQNNDISGEVISLDVTMQELGNFGNVLRQTSKTYDMVHSISQTVETTHSYFPADFTKWQLANLEGSVVTKTIAGDKPEGYTPIGDTPLGLENDPGYSPDAELYYPLSLLSNHGFQSVFYDTRNDEGVVYFHEHALEHFPTAGERASNLFYGPTSVTKETKATYDAVGRLKTEVIEPQGGVKVKVTKTYDYDAYGNAIREAVTAWDYQVSETGVEQGALATRYSISEYKDGHGRFLTAEVNDLGHRTSHVFDSERSLLLSTSDVNNLTTTYQYDAFGKTVFTRAPDRTIAVNITMREDESDSEIAFIRRSQSSGSPPASVYVDYLGREVITEAMNFHGDLVRTRVEFDQNNRQFSESYPYYVGEEITVAAEVERYDKLHRPLVTRYADGSTQEVEYGILRANQINREGQSQTSVQDAFGRTIQAQDNGGNTMRYFHDVNGNVTKTIVSYQDTDLPDHTLTAAFDPIFGYKLSTTDPALGTSRSFYNGFGEVYKRLDNLGNSTCSGVDTLGRVTRRVIKAANGSVESLTSYIYDDAPGASLGSLHRTEMYDASGQLTYSSEITYDRLGRVPSTTMQSKNPATDQLETFTSSSTFDSLGRTLTETNAGGLSLRHVYNELGFEAKIVNAITGEVYWQPEQYDVRGNLIRETLASGAIRTTRAYEATDNVLESSVSTQGARTLQSFGFAWNNIGHLTFREDRTTPSNIQREDFEYDHWNRLSSVSLAGGRSQSFTYDANGNLRTKPGAGSLEYNDATSPHRVTDYQKTSGGSTTAHQFTYDANGRFRQEHQNGQLVRNVTWTAFGKPKVMVNVRGPQIRNHNGSVRYHKGLSVAHFTYDAGLNRMHQLLNRVQIESQTNVTKQVLTTYLGSYERKIHYTVNGSGRLDVKTVHRHSLGVALVIETDQGTDGTIDNRETLYQLTDHIGSLTALVKQEGASWNVVERHAFDAWGSRRSPTDWSRDANYDDVKTSDRTTRGYTGHEMLDEIGLIHMNGRIYHAEIGRFLSPDPVIQAPTNSQNFNRYTYVLNNPLSYTDPSGYFIAELITAVKAIAAVFTANSIVGAIVAIGKLVVATVKLVVAVAKFLYATPQSVQHVFAQGFALGFGNALVDGQGFVESVRSGLISGTQALAFAFAGGDPLSNALISGVFSEISGGDFADGFIDSVIASAIGYTSDKLSVSVLGFSGASQAQGPNAKALQSAIVGAVTATVTTQITGGSWGKSFITSYLQHLYSEDAQSVDYEVAIDYKWWGDFADSLFSRESLEYVASPEYISDVTEVGKGALKAGGESASFGLYEAEYSNELQSAGGAIYNTAETTGAIVSGGGTVKLIIKRVGKKRAPKNTVNLASPQRTKHILTGDATGGGHKFGLTRLFNGKSKFPITWNKNRIMNAVSEVATNPANRWVQQTGRPGSLVTRAGDPVKFKVEGVFDGVKMRVIVQGDDIITAFPIK